MAMWITTLLFVIMSAFLVRAQVRSHGRRGAPAAARPRPCPRCHAAVPAGAAQCPSCHAPLQAFELVSAPIVTAAAAEPSGPLHAIVRADVCVGCGTCVDACPEPGAIRLQNKLAIVNLDLCKGHAKCAAACPVSAIVVTSGAAVQRVEVPDLTVHFESNVRGLYVVGELGGRGLIKNAINEGKLAAEHITSELRGTSPPDDTTVDVVVVGSGPAGLSAALEATRARLRVVVLEQGSLSDTIHRYPRQKLLFAEPIKMPLYGDLWVADATKESLLRVWQTVIERTRLDVRTHQRVEGVTHDGTRFHVRSADREVLARRVVLAMGRRGTPRQLGVNGEALDKVFYDIAEMEVFRDQRLLVVGGGDSALESALGLANQHGTTVTISHRGADFARARERNRAKLDAAVAAGRIRLLLESQVREIRPEVVVLEHHGRVHLEPNDVVIVRIGGDAPYPFLERLGVRIVRKEIALDATARSSAG